MRRANLLVVAVYLFTSSFVSADIFGIGDNQFEIEFVTISGDANPISGFGIVNNDYRMGTYEITNNQWNKFQSYYGSVRGNPSSGYNSTSTYTGSNIPVNEVSWYEAAQFVNWLNTSTGHSIAYKFTGTQGTSDYTFVPWEFGDVGYDASNQFRNSNAFYFLPTEDEWVKAAYWNGTTRQNYATIGDIIPIPNLNSNFDQPYPWDGPWDVGSGSEELNGTYDMMGNVWEWMESPYYTNDFSSGAYRVFRGGAFYDQANEFTSPYRGVLLNRTVAYSESPSGGFRVASIPEPATLSLLTLGAFLAGRRKTRA